MDNSGTGLILFDADCGFCTRSARWARGRALRSTLTPVSYRDADLAALGLTPQRCAQELHVIGHDGAVHIGGDAIAEVLLTSRPIWRPLAWALRLPGARRVAQAAYQRIAANRHRLPGGTATCSLRDGLKTD